ncbi:MAG TPA: Ig-like domain-containing protein [Anaerolineae bacterium]|nr:Ig-like domain-containing protein [Anaerolineae bacterium]
MNALNVIRTSQQARSPIGYTVRVGLLSLALALTALAAIAFAPRVDEVSVLEQLPNGMGVALDSPIRITFSRPVDRRSAERAFLIYPIVRGHFEWRAEATVLFVPDEPMLPDTLYSVAVRPGLRDMNGRINRSPTIWVFRTLKPAEGGT